MVIVLAHFLQATLALRTTHLPAARTTVSLSAEPTQEPLLLRAAKGEATESVPVWMMRQAGRHMQSYRNLVKKYPTFRERSEIPEVSLEISLQPYNAYRCREFP